MKDSYKILLSSVIASVSLWIFDAVVDSYIFYDKAFRDSLIFNIPVHELYFRTFLTVSFIAFGALTAFLVARKKKLEEQILQAENDWEDSFDTITDAITIHDKDFNIIRANKAAKKLLASLSSEENGARKCYELFHGKSAAPGGCPTCEVLKTGNPAVSEFFEPHLNRFIEVRGMPRFGTGNRIVGVTHVVRDITDQKQIEELLKQHQERLEELVKERTAELRSANERELKLLKELKTIFDTFPVGIVYLDNKYKIIRSNRFFNDFLGFREEDIIGKQCYDVAGENPADPAKEGIDKVCSFCKKAECFETKRPSIIERPLNDKFVRVTTIPGLDESGNISHFIEIVEDITGRKLAEIEAFTSSRLASIGELAAGVAHEINNPINGIIGLSQILVNESEKGSKESDVAKRIIREGHRIATIVSGLLSFARVNKENKKPVRIHKIMSDSIGLTGTQIQKDGIKLTINLPQDLPEIVAHPQQIEQVFLNVLSNARYALNQKYPGAHNDKILEILGKKIMLDNNHYARISFYDTGTGIPSDIMDKVMNPFFSTKPGNAGTGLGLSISHGIISDHGGRIMIESVEGEFTRVLIDLPARGEI